MINILPAASNCTTDQMSPTRASVPPDLWCSEMPLASCTVRANGVRELRA